jgi:KDO2-lipid IV(A) lauroyltransferase
LSLISGALEIRVIAPYRPLKPVCIDLLMRKIRSRFGSILIPDSQIVRHFLSMDVTGSLYIFIADQCPLRVESMYSCEFLHQWTSIYAGVEKLSTLRNVPVYYLRVLRVSRGCYEVYCELLTSSPRSLPVTSLSHLFMSRLESNIIASPSGWLWTHKRWKR